MTEKQRGSTEMFKRYLLLVLLEDIFSYILKKHVSFFYRFGNKYFGTFCFLENL